MLLGVGTGFGGLQDILVNQSAGGGPSESEAREAIERNPNDAQAHYDLSSALQGQGEVEEAIPPLAKYTRLRPGDLDAKRELAGLYLRQAETHRRAAQFAQIQLQTEAPGQTFQPPPDSKLNQALAPDQITAALSAKWNEQLTTELTAMQSAYTKAVRVYKQIVKSTPTDASAQLELAQTAEAANDITTAIAAYEKFLELAPDDQSAPAVRDRIKQLEASVTAAAGR